MASSFLIAGVAFPPCPAHALRPTIEEGVEGGLEQALGVSKSGLEIGPGAGSEQARWVLQPGLTGLLERSVVSGPPIPPGRRVTLNLASPAQPEKVDPPASRRAALDAYPRVEARLSEDASEIARELRILLPILHRDEAEYGRVFGEIADEEEASKEALDTAWTCSFFGQDVRAHRFLPALQAEALVKPGSPTDRIFWTPAKANQSVDLLEAGRLVSGLAGELAMVLGVMERLLREGADHWAYAYFLYYFSAKNKALLDAEKSRPGIARRAPDNPRVGGAMLLWKLLVLSEIRGPKILISKAKEPDPMSGRVEPGRKSFELLGRLYHQNWRADEERSSVLSGQERVEPESPPPAARAPGDRLPYIRRSFETFLRDPGLRLPPISLSQEQWDRLRAEGDQISEAKEMLPRFNKRVLERLCRAVGFFQKTRDPTHPGFRKVRYISLIYRGLQKLLSRLPEASSGRAKVLSVFWRSKPPKGREVLEFIDTILRPVFPDFMPPAPIPPDRPITLGHLQGLTAEIRSQIHAELGWMVERVPGGSPEFRWRKSRRVDPDYRTPAGRPVPVYERISSRAKGVQASGAADHIQLDSSSQIRLREGWKQTLEFARHHPGVLDGSKKLGDLEKSYGGQVRQIVGLIQAVLSICFYGADPSSEENVLRARRHELLLEEGVHSDTLAFADALVGDPGLGPLQKKLRHLSAYRRAVIRQGGSLEPEYAAAVSLSLKEQEDLIEETLELEVALDLLQSGRFPAEALFHRLGRGLFGLPDLSPGHRQAQDRLMVLLGREWPELSGKELDDVAWRRLFAENILPLSQLLKFNDRIRWTAAEIRRKEFTSLAERERILPQPWGRIGPDRPTRSSPAAGLESDPSAEAQRLRNHGRSLLDRKMYPAAAETFSKMLQQPDLDSSPVFRGAVFGGRAEAWMGLRQWGKAEADLREVLTLNGPDNERNAWVYVRLATACLANGKAAEAQEAVSASIRLNPAGVGAYIKRAEILIALGKYKEAEEDANKAVGLDPGSAAAHVWRATARMDLRRWDEAAADWEKVLDLNGPGSRKNEGVHRQLVKIRLEQEIELIRPALDLMGRKLWDQAEPVWRKVVDSQRDGDPRKVESFVNLATVLIKNGKFAEAEEAASSALRLDPGAVGALVRRAEARMILQKWDEARADLEKILALNGRQAPLNAGFYLRLATIDLQQGNPAGAERHLREGIQLPAPARHKAPLQEMLARIFQDQGRHDEALHRWTRAIDSRTQYSPGSLPALLARAELFILLKRTSFAMRDLRRALDLDADNLQALERLRSLCQSTHRFEEAGALHLRIDRIRSAEEKATRPTAGLESDRAEGEETGDSERRRRQKAELFFEELFGELAWTVDLSLLMNQTKKLKESETLKTLIETGQMEEANTREAKIYSLLAYGQRVLEYPDFPAEEQSTVLLSQVAYMMELVEAERLPEHQTVERILTDFRIPKGVTFSALSSVYRGLYKRSSKEGRHESQEKIVFGYLLKTLAYGLMGFLISDDVRAEYHRRIAIKFYSTFIVSPETSTTIDLEQVLKEIRPLLEFSSEEARRSLTEDLLKPDMGTVAEVAIIAAHVLKDLHGRIGNPKTQRDWSEMADDLDRMLQWPPELRPSVTGRLIYRGTLSGLEGSMRAGELEIPAGGVDLDGLTVKATGQVAVGLEAILEPGQAAIVVPVADQRVVRTLFRHPGIRELQAGLEQAGIRVRELKNPAFSQELLSAEAGEGDLVLLPSGTAMAEWIPAMLRAPVLIAPAAVLAGLEERQFAALAEAARAHGGLLEIREITQTGLEEKEILILQMT